MCANTNTLTQTNHETQCLCDSQHHQSVNSFKRIRATERVCRVLVCVFAFTGTSTLNCQQQIRQDLKYVRADPISHLSLKTVLFPLGRVFLLVNERKSIRLTNDAIWHSKSFLGDGRFCSRYSLYTTQLRASIDDNNNNITLSFGLVVTELYAAAKLRIDRHTIWNPLSAQPRLTNHLPDYSKFLVQKNHTYFSSHNFSFSFGAKFNLCESPECSPYISFRHTFAFRAERNSILCEPREATPYFYFSCRQKCNFVRAQKSATLLLQSVPTEIPFRAVREKPHIFAFASLGTLVLD